MTRNLIRVIYTFITTAMIWLLTMNQAQALEQPIWNPETRSYESPSLRQTQNNPHDYPEAHNLPLPPRRQNAAQQPKIEQDSTLNSPHAKTLLKAGIDKGTIKKVFDYFQQNSKSFPNRNYMTFINFTLPSSEKRMFILNLKTGQLEKHYVSHGRGSGAARATAFTNQSETEATSLGFYRTAETYTGDNGVSLRVDGLSSTNVSARHRNIVFHPAKAIKVPINGIYKNIPYVSETIVKVQGYLGRSNGCFAMDPAKSQMIIDRLKHGSLVYAFTNSSYKKGSYAEPDHQKSKRQNIQTTPPSPIWPNS